jgi:hypothetical protein
VGIVPYTFAIIGAHGPAALKAILQADGVLAASSLSKQDQETVKSIVSEGAGCGVAAHSLLGKLAALKPEALKQIRAGQPTGDAKRDALVRFVRNLALTSGTISDAEFAAIKAAGGHQPGDRSDGLHQGLQPHQRHRNRLSRGRVNAGPFTAAVTKGVNS